MVAISSFKTSDTHVEIVRDFMSQNTVILFNNLDGKKTSIVLDHTPV
jgi:hypothetical protein